MSALLGEFWNLATGLAWRGSLVVAGFLVLRALAAGRIPPQWLFAGWLVVALRLVVPAGVATKWSPFNWPAAKAGAITLMAPLAPVPSEAKATLAPAMDPTAAVGAPTPSRRSLQAWLALGWLVGAGACWSVRLAGVRRQFRRWQGNRAPTPQWVVDLLAAEVGSPGWWRQPRACVSAAVGTPAISGLLRPTLWLPAGLAERLGAEHLRAVVRHELAHWRRGDLWAMELLAFARVLHWWNPLVWLAVNTARADCELACDEFVMQRTVSAEPSAYGASLLKVLGAAGGRTGTSAALGVFNTRKQLKRRIQMIANYRAPSRGRTLLGAALVAAVMVVAATRELRAQEPVAGGAGAVTTSAPAGWWENGNATDKYVVGVDATQGRPAPAAYVKSIASTKNTFGGMMQTCDAKSYRGKRARLSGLLKTADAPKGACLWLRVDGADGKVLAFDNMQRQPVAGTEDWTPAEIVLDVPPDAATLNFGFFLMDTGQAWVSGLAFAEAGASVLPTGMQRPIPDKPTNLGFAPQVTP